MTTRGTLLAKGITAGRVLYGIGCMAAPRTMTGTAGTPAEGSLVWMTRAFGVRDLVLGAGTFLAVTHDGEAAVRWVELSAAADALDVANAAAFHRELGRSGVLTTFAIAVPAALGGWLAARDLRQGV